MLDNNYFHMPIKIDINYFNNPYPLCSIGMILFDYLS